MQRIVNRRHLLVGASAFAICAPYVSRKAHAAEFSLKYGNDLPSQHPMNLRAAAAIEKIAAETKGRVEIKLFANNALGSDSDMISQLRTGALEFFSVSGTILSVLVQVAAIGGVGFAFPDYPAFWKAMDGTLGSHVRGQIAKSGIYTFDRLWDNGFRQITSATKPINSPADLKGFKIRVPISPLFVSMFKAFEASPTSINFGEVYTALQTRIVDGQENPLAIISTAKLYEVQKYCSLTNHIADGFWFMANAKMWQQMPADLRDIISRNINEAALLERQDIATLNETIVQTLEKQGLVFNRPNTEPFREMLRKANFYSEWKQKFGEEAWAVLESNTGKLS